MRTTNSKVLMNNAILLAQAAELIQRVVEKVNISTPNNPTVAKPTPQVMRALILKAMTNHQSFPNRS